MLANTLAKQEDRNYLFTKVNLEDYKDVSFPNSILLVLIKFLEQLIDEIRNRTPWYIISKRKLISKIESEIRKYRDTLNDPDDYSEKITQKEAHKVGSKVSVAQVPISASVDSHADNETEVQKSVSVNKLEKIKNNLTEVKKLITDISSFFGGQHIFLVLDDFYFIKKAEQPKLIDYFHRLSKDTELYIKVATIKHRSTLYTSDSQTYVGIEIGSDAQSIELDYTLDQFDLLKKFMRDLLNQAKVNSGSNTDPVQLISSNGFTQLCLASGGVPRDFLALFIKLGNKIANGLTSIDKPAVNEVAIENLQNKLSTFNNDSAEERGILEKFLNYFQKFLFEEKKTNMFLVNNSELQSFSQVNRAINELVDLRFLHLVNSNTSSAPSDGHQYSAYMIDTGLYPNKKPRNFNQIEPGVVDDKSRRDNIRSAPKINLVHLSQQMAAEA